MKDNKQKKGKLFVVATPIGNFRDITLRALGVLKDCDIVVCETYKVAAALLKNIGITKDLIELNKKNEEEVYPEILDKIKSGNKVALVSDAGTPLFADPGDKLFKAALHWELDTEIVPGVTSIMPALVRSGFSLDSFHFAGFVSRFPKERKEELYELSKLTDTTCLLETPYRLSQFLEDAAKVMPNRPAYIGMNLTMPQEKHHYGSFTELYEKFKERNVKAEFVIVFQGNHFEKMKKERRKNDRS